MTRFSRGWIAFGSIALSLAGSAALYAQSGAPSNPLRGNQQSAGNQPAHGGQPRVATQPSGSPDSYPRPPGGSQANPSGQSNGTGQPNYGAQPSGGYRPPYNQAGNGQAQKGGGVLPNQASARPVQLPIQPPFVLSPQEQADVDKLLADWEAQSDKIKSFKCNFRRWEYNPAFANGDPNQATTESEGEIKYYAPDKGLFRVTKCWDNVFDPMTREFQKTPEKPGEYWTCTGTSVYEVNHLNKTVEEHPLPPHLQGKAIANGPLPFVFGAKATTLMQRYFLRIATPPGVANKEIWLEAIPKTRQDAANFSRVELILDKQKLLPLGMQIHDPGATARNPARTAIMLSNHSVNNPWLPIQQIFNDFARPDFPTYKHVVVQPPVQGPTQHPPASQTQNPGANSPPRQAALPQTGPRR